MRSLPDWSRLRRIAGMGLALSTLGVGVSVVRALLLDPVHPAPLGPPRAPEVSVPTATVRQVDVAAVVDVDPFHPERRRPAHRFPLPEDPSLEAGMEPASGPPRVELAGTMRLPDGRDAAIVRLPDEPTRIVRVGETVGSLTLQTVERGQAVFLGPDKTPVTLRTRDGRG